MPKSNSTSSARSGGRRRSLKKGNYAFIDSQNLHLSIRDAGWKLDLARFRVYLAEKYGVTVAYLFMGYMEEYQDLYLSLQKDGFIIIYKDILRTKDGTVKGNVDAELVLQAMIDYPSYERAVIVTGDGDFACLVRYLEKNNKLETLLVPNQRKYSSLLNKAAGKRIAFVSDLRKKLGYKGRSGLRAMGDGHEVAISDGRVVLNTKAQKATDKSRGVRGGKRLETKPRPGSEKKPTSPVEGGLSAAKKPRRRGHRGGRGRRPKSDKAE